MRLVWTKPAELDLYRIADDLEARQPGSALIMLRRVYQSPTPLLEHPLIGSPTRKSGVRKWPVAKTPFILLYAPRQDVIEIRRVVHNRSDWLSLQP
jgi:toxin ParE1/3/4